MTRFEMMTAIKRSGGLSDFGISFSQIRNQSFLVAKLSFLDINNRMATSHVAYAARARSVAQQVEAYRKLERHFSISPTSRQNP
jgi:hypothetical protein